MRSSLRDDMSEDRALGFTLPTGMIIQTLHWFPERLEERLGGSDSYSL